MWKLTGNNSRNHKSRIDNIQDEWYLLKAQLKARENRMERDEEKSN